MGMKLNNDKIYRDLKLIISEEIDNVRSGSSDKSLKQLLKIEEEIDIMYLDDDYSFRPAYPHIIIDSWDFNDPLGILLINFNDLYSRMRKNMK